MLFGLQRRGAARTLSVEWPRLFRGGIARSVVRPHRHLFQGARRRRQSLHSAARIETGRRVEPRILSPEWIGRVRLQESGPTIAKLPPAARNAPQLVRPTANVITALSLASRTSTEPCCPPCALLDTFESQQT